MNTTNNPLEFLEKLIFKEKRIFKGPLGEEERYSATDNRYTEYLKNPERTPNDKDEWFIYVPSCFNGCLDITKTDRRVKTGHKIKDTKTGKMKDETEVRKVWTQGSRFAFHRGCTLYDTPKAYNKWRNAIKEIKYCISIQEATSAKPAMNKDERDPGEVIFTIFSLSFRIMRLKETGKFTLTQDQFVRFLIIGDSEIL